MKYLFIISFYFLISGSLNAQKIQVIHKNYGDSICLRWYPQNLTQWKDICQYGIGIQRRTLLHETSNPVSVYQVQKSLKPDADTTAAFALLDSILNATEINLNDISHFQEAQINQQNNFLFAMLLCQKSYPLAKKYALGFTDSQIDSAEIYFYKIYLLKPGFTDTLFLVVRPQEPNNIHFAPPGLSHENGMIKLDVETKTIMESFPMFYIQKSLDNKSFLSIHPEPFFSGFHIGENQSFTMYDSLYGDTAYYRLQAIDAFGNIGGYSNSAVTYTHIKSVSLPRYFHMEEQLYSKEFQWVFPAEEEKYILGFALLFSDSIDGNPNLLHQKYIPANNRNLSISPEFQSGYYTIAAVHKDSSLNPGLPVFLDVPDSIAPEAPVNAAGFLDTCGYLSLLWKSNKEKDFHGYQVYRSYQRNTEFNNVTPRWILDTIFFDTLDMGWNRDSVFYKIVAADHRFSESSFSEIIALEIPLNLIPSTPLIQDLKSISGKVQMYLYPSTGTKVKYHYVFRSTNEEPPILLHRMQTITDTGIWLEDADVKAGNRYSYSIQSENYYGKKSLMSPAITIEISEKACASKIRFSDFFMDSSAQKVYLSWEIQDTEISHFRLLWNENGKFKTIANYQSHERNATILCSGNCNISQFTIIAYYKDGRRSSL
ncbi:MAG: hypothetical protein KG003_11595 [Bacteroidetes bacterium]|nr:hypothetical protein [Bacteroidota bacterium]